MQKADTVAILGCGWLGLPLGVALGESGRRVHGSARSAERLNALAAAGLAPFRVALEPDWQGDAPADFLRARQLVIALPPGRRQHDGGADYPRKIDAIGSALAGTPVEQVLFVSSTSVYPDLNREVTESDAGHGVVWEAEQRVRRWPGIRATVVRMAGLYGYDRQPGRFLAGRQEVPHGRAPVNLIHRDDAVGILRAVIVQGAWGQTFNACADAHPARRVFYPAQARRLGVAEPTFLDEPDYPFKIVENTRLRRDLGYALIHPDPMAPAP
ncbi:MAG: SDR family oxidoreductase [Rhodothermales bacterium]